MKIAVILSILIAATLVSTGCGSGDGGTATTQPEAKPAGTVKDGADTKNGQPTTKGLSPNDLKAPPNGGEAQFGAKTGGK